MAELTGREMSGYSAWTVIGVVTGLKASAETAPKDALSTARGGATGNADKQIFSIRQRDGRDIEMTLAEASAGLRNGHVVTAVWVARKGVKHGFCVLLDNQTTGERLRLDDNIKLIRPKVSLAQTAKFGLIATLPALIAMVLWTLVPGSLDAENIVTFAVVALVALVVLFAIGLIVAKLVLDYLNTDHHQRIWQAAREVADDLRARQAAPPRSQP